MDRLTRMEEIKKHLSELKANKPDAFKKATDYVAELSAKFPALNAPEKTDNSDYAQSVRELRLLMAYAYSQVGDKITPTVEGAFKSYSGSFAEALQGKIKQTAKASISYLNIAIDNQLQKLERSHEVFVLKKQGPRDVEVPKRDADGNPVTQGGVIIKEKRSILSVTLWINDMKDLASISIWGTKNDGDEVAPEHIPYENMQVNHGYRMLLNYNGKAYFSPRDPMIQPVNDFTPDYVGMVKIITEKFNQMQEPYDSPGNMDPQKLYYLIGKVTKDPSGGVIISPMEPTNSILQLQRTNDARLLEDGDDVLILGNIGKSRSFTGRDGKEIKANSDFTIFPSAVIRLTEPSENDVEEENETVEENSENLQKDLGL